MRTIVHNLQRTIWELSLSVIFKINNEIKKRKKHNSIVITYKSLLLDKVF
jgi:hypothetical protein